ncbi:MAG TPA: hypothetical protein VNB86_03840 [Gaiellaceae bacterium]|nr:hypothetical protein [Gaiellaceae bacterium]
MASAERRRLGRRRLTRCRASTREIVALERELEARTQTLAPAAAGASWLRPAERGQAAE